MNDTLSNAKEILEKLVSYSVLSGESNLPMVEYMVALLDQSGIQSQLVYAEDKTRANLFATIGPQTANGVMLSGHTDVVAVSGQNWTTDPFVLHEKNSRLYGRGTTDMKGFLACCLASVPVWVQQDLKRPIQLGFTYDEETGCYGARRLSQWLKQHPLKPGQAIIGEPTRMNIVAGHKGGSEITTIISGVESHSSRPDLGVNAIHYAGKLIAYILQLASQLEDNRLADSDFRPPYSTINIGTINGGSARNTIAGRCSIEWETRTLPADSDAEIISQVDDYCQHVLLPEMQQKFPQSTINTLVKALVPGLEINDESSTISMIETITGQQGYDVVSFGTDAGYFSHAGISCAVYGPGCLDQAHKPDEYIEISQLAECLAFLELLGNHLR